MKRTFTFCLAALFLSISSFCQNRALHFDGIDDHVVIPARTGVLTGSTITFEAWVKPSSLDHSFMPIINRGNNSNYFLVYFQNMAMDPFDPQTLELNVFVSNGEDNGQLFHSISSDWIGQWHHVAVTYNGNTLALYIDGALITSTPFSGPIPMNSESTWLGSFGGYDNFNGTIDEVRIWNVARTQAEIQATRNTEIPVGTAGLTAYYKFNQGFIDGNNSSITALTDYKASNNGVLNNFAKTGASSNFTAGYGSISVLALKEGSFTVAKKSNAVQLNWESLSSGGGSFFTIERSQNGVDFTSIGKVNEIPLLTETAYSFTDASPLATKNFYRIKSTEANGNVSYTQTLVIAMNKTIPGLQISPNPVTASLQLQVTAPKGLVVVELKDLAGRTLRSIRLTSQGTTLYQAIDVSTLAKGMYALMVGGESTVFIKQ